MPILALKKCCKAAVQLRRTESGLCDFLATLMRNEGIQLVAFDICTPCEEQNSLNKVKRLLYSLIDDGASELL